ncbi:MAG: glycogen synthase [Oscillospiraceae bacterium]|nr:glycogen synthase [Oscillospiraceae bacterium]
MNILFAASEAAPFCKTGGLADVAGSLPVALAEGGDNVAVILPLYGQIGEEWRSRMTYRKYIYVDLAWRHEYCGLFSLSYRGVTWYFVDNEKYFRRGALYGEFDDGERFAFFCRAVADLLPHLDDMPQVVHCNDWQTALLPVYLKDYACRAEAYRGVRSVYTVHNMEYQGWLPGNTVEDLLGLDRGWWDTGVLRRGDAVNLMQAALLTADAVTTVSPTYAWELRDPAHAHGLEDVIAAVGYKLTGILNGIDVASFDPHTDKALCARYSAARPGGKAKCKAALQQQVGLAPAPDVPLIAIVSRLVGHKGMDLVCAALEGIMNYGAQLVVLGKGEPGYEDFFRHASEQYAGRVAACITYSDALARQIYAGADLFLMPSRSEPCGLSQMIAMRYGTVPIVRQTGGLNDSVRSCQAGQADGTGFVFASYDAWDMLYVIGEACRVYGSDYFKAVQRRAMSEDFSWGKSAGIYRDIYEKLPE